MRHCIIGLVVSVLVLTCGLYAQVDRGSITGTVTDASGAVVAETAVTATNINTGVKYPTASNQSGFYRISNLPVGKYALQLKKTGFKEFKQTGITLNNSQVAEINVVLEIGASEQVVTVTADAPVLQTATSTERVSMVSSVITDLPLSASGGRAADSFVYALSPTVTGSGYSTSVGGSQNFTKQVLVDGVSADAGIPGDIAETEPTMEAVQEVSVDTTGISAEAGRTGGGSIEMTIKSGTNKLHGSTFGVLANEFLNANTWNNNFEKAYHTALDPANAATYANKYRTARNRYFDYGGSLGGPIWKNRTFIFGAIEHYQADNWVRNPTGQTVPTTAFLNGDFSALLDTTKQLGVDGAGNPIYKGAIFNPATGNVFLGNIIPQTMFSERSKAIVDVFKKYYQPVNGNLVNNYPKVLSSQPRDRNTQITIKLDHNFSDTDRLSATYMYARRPRINGSGFMQSDSTEGGPLTTVESQTTISNQYRIQQTHTFTPTLLNTLSLAYNEFDNKWVPLDGSISQNWPDSLGLSSVDPLKAFPQMTFSGVNGYSEPSVGVGNFGYTIPYQRLLNDSLTWVKGKHTFKFGGEIRSIAMNSGGSSGQLTYNFTNAGAPQALASAPCACLNQVGFGFANFLLGYVTSAQRGIAFDQHGRRKSYGLFVQDDFKATDRLTLNLGLRWDANGRLHELDGKWSNFDLNAVNPLFGGYKGALTWLDSPSDSFETNENYRQFGPHVGAAFKVTNKLVARGSYGIYYVPLGNLSWEPVPFGFALGYKSVDQTAPVGNNLPSFQWDQNPYAGVVQPGQQPGNFGTYLPWGQVSIDPNTLTLGRTQNWFLGGQYELSSDMRFSATYIGNVGQHLHDGLLNPLNYPTWETYSSYLQSGANLGGWYNSASGAAAAKLPFPYPGWASTAYYAINPYPQVGTGYGPIFFTDSGLGHTTYNAMVLELTKRGSHGLSMDFNYTLQSGRGDTNSALVEQYGTNGGKAYQDPYNLAAEEKSPFTRKNVFKGYFTYDLPVGRGKRFLSGSGRTLNMLVGGFEIGMYMTYQSGGPKSHVNASSAAKAKLPGWSGLYTNVASNADFSNTFKTANPEWNPAKGADPASLFVDTSIFSDPAPGTLGNSPTVLENWHGFGYSDEDLSIMKNIRFGQDDRFRIQLRAEFFDVFNRHYWDTSNSDINSPYFGHVMGSSTGYRWGQLGARFEF